MRPGKVDAVPSETVRRLDETRPGKAAVLLVQDGEARWESRDAAGGDSDGVVNQLRPERDVELEQLDSSASLAAEAGGDDEAVEVPRLP